VHGAGFAPASIPRDSVFKFKSKTISSPLPVSNALLRLHLRQVNQFSIVAKVLTHQLGVPVNAQTVYHQSLEMPKAENLSNRKCRLTVSKRL
jgi:hypothetical protein